LSLYHGHIGSDREAAQRGDIGSYAAATLLQDLDNPSKIVGMSREPVMLADAEFERSGYLPNIVFPTALLRRGDEVDVYYGAADTATGVARYALEDLLATTD
jgi:predicted GH43/DUF377 family glycosyl hydrolase